MGRDQRQNPFGSGSATGPGPTAVLDSLGRPLEAGDAVVLKLQGTPIYRVVAITPVLDPQAPPGLQTIQVGFLAEFVVKPTTPLSQITRVAPAAEAGPSPFGIPGDVQ